MSSDIIGLIVFSAFGLWLVIAPQRVINFYSRFHRKPLNAKPMGTRIAGLLWIILVVCVIVFIDERSHLYYKLILQ